jgi:hypothetical protein
MPRKRKTPQEKKKDSYKKDRRNVYGERGSHSRHAVTRAKRARQSVQRAAARQAVDAAVRDPGLAERLEGRSAARRGNRWQKVPDAPLEEVIERKLNRRARTGSLPKPIAERKKSRVRRLT